MMELSERLMPLRVRGESWASCVLSVPVTILLLLLCATLRSLLDVAACASDPRMCVSANGVLLEPLRPGTGVGELLRMVSVGNISAADALGGAREPGGVPLASSYLSQPWLRPAVVGEEAALLVHDACTPSTPADYDYKACADECKAGGGNRHCHFCKCQACLFCRPDLASGVAHPPVASIARERLLVVGARSGPEARHARAIGHNIALLGFEVHFLGAPYGGPPNGDTRAEPANAGGNRPRRRGAGLHEVSLHSALASSVEPGYATVIVHLHLLSGTRHAGGAGPYAELIKRSGNAGSQVICVCARAQPPSILDALWRRLWIPRYCHRAFILPNDGAP